MNKSFDPEKLGEEADQMIAQLNSSTASETTEEDSPELEAAVEETAVEEADTIAAEGETPSEDQGVTPEDVAPPEDNDELAELKQQVANLTKELEAANQRWNVSKGMIAKKDDDIASMRELLSQMAEKQAAPEAKVEEKPAEIDLSKFEEDYGKDMVDMVRNIAAQIAKQSVHDASGKFTSDIKEIKGSVDGMKETAAHTAQSLFESELARLVPNWETLNHDEGFIEWLSVTDPLAPASRGKLLNAAVAQGDASKTAKFFDAYTSEVEAASPPPTKRSNGKDKLVAPGKTKSSIPPQEEARIWTRADIAKVYDDRQAGKISAKEFDKLERDIFAAQHENRVAM